MTLEQSVVGHEQILSRLQKQCDTGRVSHAYLFSGRKGVGKNTVARAFAHCLTEGSVADITTVTNETYQIKTAALSVDAVRAARADMFVKPYAAQRRVFLFPRADSMTLPAQNALLKVLEEPPAYCVIILIAEQAHQLLDTVQSRVVSVQFSPLPDKLIAQHLQQQGLPANEAIFRLAQGSIGRAMELASNEETAVLLERFTAMAQALLRPEKAPVYELISLFEREKAQADLLLEALLLLFRETLLKKPEQHDTMLFGQLSQGVAARVIELVENSRNALAFHANYSMVVSELLLQTWEAIHG